MDDVPGRHYATGQALKHFHRRTAFQAELLQLPVPWTSSPVIVASLRTAFQAVNTFVILDKFD